MTRWYYYKIYLQQENTSSQQTLTTAGDRLLQQICQPLLEAAQSHVNRWFFIRYIDSGYHIRLRVHGETDALQRHLFEPLKARLAAFYREQGITDNPASMIKEAVYEPESIKYGTGKQLSLVEDHFQYSSEIVLRVLQLEEETRVPRALWVAALIDAALQQTLPDLNQRAVFLLSLAGYWLYGQPESTYTHLDAQYQRKQALLQRMLPRLQQQPLFDAWGAHWQTLYRRLTAFEDKTTDSSPVLDHLRPQLTDLPGSSALSQQPLTHLLILPNLLHLVSNRAGVGIHQEAQLAYFLYRLLNVEPPQPPIQLLLEPDLPDAVKSLDSSTGR